MLAAFIGTSMLAVQAMPLKSGESRTTTLSRCGILELSEEDCIMVNCKPRHEVKSMMGLLAVVRMPTNPPELASVTRPFHNPEALSKLDADAPPMTTSSSGAHWKPSWLLDEDVTEDGSHNISPGLTTLDRFDDCETKNGRFTNLEDCWMNRNTFQG